MRTKFWSDKLTGKDHPEFLGIVGRIILEWISGKFGGKMWTGFIWLRIGTGSGLL
jgi:hypothetical protein